MRGVGAAGGALGGGTDLSALGLTSSGTASNAAGVITYCMKNNYLNADKAAQVKDQLLGKLGLGTQKQEAPKDQGYLNGLGGHYYAAEDVGTSVEDIAEARAWLAEREHHHPDLEILDDDRAARKVVQHHSSPR